MGTYIWTEIATEGNSDVTAFHKAKIQGNSMFTYFGRDINGPTNAVKKLDLDSYLWEKLGEIDGKFLQGFTSCENEDMLYFLYAYSQNEIYEPIFSINVTDNPTNNIKVASKLVWPRKRQGHCLATTNDKLILIGGLAEDDLTYLDDVWQLDIDTVTWTKLKISGDTFEPRAFMSCHMDSGIIFATGGKNKEIVFDDTFYLNLKSLSWAKIKYISSVKTENYGSCVVSKNSVYITFGKSSNNVFLETIYIYNFTDNTIQTSHRVSGPTIQLINHVCWIKTNTNGDDEIFIATGETLNGIYNRFLYKVTVNKDNSREFHSLSLIESDELGRTMTSLIKNNYYAFMLFGVMENDIVSDSIVYIDLLN